MLSTCGWRYDIEYSRRYDLVFNRVSTCCVCLDRYKRFGDLPRPGAGSPLVNESRPLPNVLEIFQTFARVCKTARIVTRHNGLKRDACVANCLKRVRFRSVLYCITLPVTFTTPNVTSVWSIRYHRIRYNRRTRFCDRCTPSDMRRIAECILVHTMEYPLVLLVQL